MPMKILLALSLVLFFQKPIPTASADPTLVGVGKTSGPSQINGSSFADGTNLYAGDRIETGLQTQFVVLIAPQEKSILAPGSTLRLRKLGRIVVLVLTEGKVTVETEGRTQVLVVDHDLQINPAPKSSVQTEVEILNERQASVSALRGTVELIGGQASVALNSGDTALVTDNTLLPPALEKRSFFARSRDLSLLIVAGESGESRSLRFTFFTRKPRHTPYTPDDD